jgi:ferritin
MISDKMAAEMNKHVQSEMTSAYLYLSMAAHFESQDLTGFSSWMRTQAQEE